MMNPSPATFSCASTSTAVSRNALGGGSNGTGIAANAPRATASALPGTNARITWRGAPSADAPDTLAT